jgi:hypothetical protein
MAGLGAMEDEEKYNQEPLKNDLLIQMGSLKNSPLIDPRYVIDVREK